MTGVTPAAAGSWEKREGEMVENDGGINKKTRIQSRQPRWRSPGSYLGNDEKEKEAV